MAFTLLVSGNSDKSLHLRSPAYLGVAAIYDFVQKLSKLRYSVCGEYHIVLVTAFRHLPVFDKVLNPPSTGVLARAGFLNESTFRHHLIVS
ncbi:MAG: hypothetical protein EOO77_06395 [Oxalobacteraceae bacterium]|nr:MAG: hypothetical protein EOO77_06395 [Oxalobacteraceae bacterium]